MKKRISLVAIAVVCAFALCLAIVPAFAAPVTYEKIENVATGAMVYDTASGNTQALVDGIFGNDDADGWYAEPSEGYVTVRIVLDQPTSIDTVKIFPANSATIPDESVLPYAYTIEVKVGEDWVEVASDSDVRLLYEGDDTACKSYTFAAKTASEVRITMTDYFADDAGAWIAISEIQVFNAPASVAGLVNAATTANGATITATAPGQSDIYFGLNYLIDGSIYSGTDNLALGWHSPAEGNGTFAPTEENPEYITINLAEAYELQVIKIHPMQFYPHANSIMPAAFDLEISNDNGTTWEIVATATDVVSVAGGENDPLTFVLDEATEATNFRMVIKSCGQGDPAGNGLHYTCIGDIELWAEPLPEPETETLAPSAGNTETNAPAESEIESEDESLNETVAETEAPKAETEAPKAETNAPETSAPAADTADEGCASVVGISAVAVLAAAAAAVVLKKKD